MGVEDPLAAHGVQVPEIGAHPLRGAAAEPQPPLVVEATEVTGSVPDARGFASGALLGRLVHGVALRCAVVTPADGVAVDQDLADAPGRQAVCGVQAGERAVGDGDDGHTGAGDRPADARSVARGGPGRGTAAFAVAAVAFAEDLGRLDRGDRQHLRGPVRHVDPCLLSKYPAQRGHDRVGHRGPAGYDAAQVGQRMATPGGAGEVPGQVPQQSGRGEHGGDAEPFQRIDEPHRVRLRDPAGGQRREHQGGAVDQVEHPVEGLRDQGDVVTGAAVDRLDLAGDGQSHPMGVLDSLGRARASGGEADHQQVVPGRRRPVRARAAPGAGSGRGAQCGQRVTAAEPEPSQGDGDPYSGEGTAAQDAHELGEGRPDERLGAHGPVAVQHAPHTHAGIHDDGHGPDPEQCEDQREQLRAGWSHQHRLGAPGDPGALESEGQFLGRLLQLRVGDGAVPGAAADGVDHGRLVGKGAGVALQPPGHAVRGAGRVLPGPVRGLPGRLLARVGPSGGPPRTPHRTHHPSGR